MASIVSASMDSITAFSPVQYPRKDDSDFGEMTGKCVVSCHSIIFANARNCSDLDDAEHIIDYGPSTPMYQTPSPKIVPTDTPESINSQPSLLLATGSSSQGDKEVLQKVSYTESNVESALEGAMHHECGKIISEVEQKIPDPHRQNFLTLSLAKPNREQQSVKKSDSKVGSLDAEKFSLQKMYPASSQGCISVHCSTESMGGSMESPRSMSKRINSDKCPLSPKENGQKILCTNNLNEEETAGLTKIIPISTKGPSTPQQPVTHAFSVLKCEDTPGSNFRREYSSPSCRNKFSAATNNLPMKGLKYIPILQTPMEVNVHQQELTSNKASLCLSLGDGSNCGKKRKSDPSQKQSKADLGGYSHDSLSRCFLKKHKVFADKVETDLADLKVSKSINMQNSGLLPPEALALELNGNSATDSSINFCEVYPRVVMYNNCDLKLGKADATVPLGQANVKDLPKSLNITNSVELTTLHGSCQTFSAYAQGQVATVKKAPQNMSLTESDWGNFIALSSSPQTANQGDYSKSEILEHYEHRFKNLQAFLKRCDESELYYSQCLWPLPAAARNAFAVKLEQRAIMLALEEGKEFNRMNTLKVLEKNFAGNTKDAGATKILKFLTPNPS